MKRLIVPFAAVACATAVMLGMMVAQEKVPYVGTVSVQSTACSSADAATPEVYSFFGDAEKVLEKVGSLKVELPKRKFYAVLVEGPDSADVFLYEMASEGKVKLARWSGKSAAELRTKIENGIMSNRGVHCVGEQTKAVVMGLGDGLKSETVDSPATVKAIASHPLQANRGKFVRVTVVLLC